VYNASHLENFENRLNIVPCRPAHVNDYGESKLFDVITVNREGTFRNTVSINETINERNN